MSAASEGNNLLLLGFMGAGKSTVGPLLARELGFAFVDLDRNICARAGCTIAEIFEREGEEAFRRLESAELERLVHHELQVIATGGGVVTHPENWEILRRLGLTVYLEAPLPLLLARIGDGSDRPLARGEARARLEQLFTERSALYARADCKVSTLDQTPAAVAAEIARLFRAHRGC